jgi:hypothetical protein
MAAEAAGAGGNHPRTGDDIRRRPDQDRPQSRRGGPGGSSAILIWEAIMTSATTNTSRSAGGRRGARQGGGLIFFAAVLLVIVAFFNIIDGISAIANSHVFVANAHYVFANQHAWGWITLIIGVLLQFAAAGIVTGNQLARWFAVAVVGLNAIDMMFFIPAYPFWALVIIAVDVVALYALCAYGSRENLAV